MKVEHDKPEFREKPVTMALGAIRADRLANSEIGRPDAKTVRAHVEGVLRVVRRVSMRKGQ